MSKGLNCLLLLVLSVLLLPSCGLFRREEPLEPPVFNPAVPALKLQEQPIMEAGGVKGHLSMGNKFYLLGRVDDAIREYERALELHPNHVEAWYNLGIAYSREGRHAKAAEAWKRALEIEPTHEDARYSLGLSYLEGGDPDRAIRYLMGVLSLNPKNVMAYLNIGNAYFAQGMFSEAMGSYGKALSSNEDLVEARLGLDKSLAELGRLDEAINDVRDILAAHPKLPEVHRTYGLLLEKQGLEDEAAKAFLEAERLSSLMTGVGKAGEEEAVGESMDEAADKEPEKGVPTEEAEAKPEDSDKQPAPKLGE